MNLATMLTKLEFLRTTVAGQTLAAWIAFVVIIWVAFLALGITKKIVVRRVAARAQKGHGDLWNVADSIAVRTNALFLAVIALYFGSMALSLQPKVSWALNIALITAFICQAAIWADQAATYLLSRVLRMKLGHDAGVTSTAEALRFFARLAIWSLALLLILSNLQVNVTTLIAGLGVGGIALALAVNQILGDFFASMAILLDKPFDVGHFIMFDNFSGNVEHIGFKTTRVRSVTGEELVIGNNNLLQSRIRNYRRLRERRVLFVLAIKDEAPHEKLADVPAMVREIIKKVPNTRFDRAHFKDYANSAVNYEVVYFVEDQDLIAYMDAQQRINLDVLRRFRESDVPLMGITQPGM